VAPAGSARSQIGQAATPPRSLRVRGVGPVSKPQCGHFRLMLLRLQVALPLTAPLQLVAWFAAATFSREGKAHKDEKGWETHPQKGSKKMGRVLCGWGHLPSSIGREAPRRPGTAQVLSGLQAPASPGSPATMPSLKKRRIRPVALRRTLSSGLPLSSSFFISYKQGTYIRDPLPAKHPHAKSHINFWRSIRYLASPSPGGSRKTVA
jgi:hypothetical protein